MTVGAEGGGGLQLRQILGIFVKWRWVTAVVTIAAVGTAGFLSWFVLPKVYDATTTLAVSPAVASTPAASSGSSGQGLQGVVQSVSSLSPSAMGTYIWEATSLPLLQSTSKALHSEGIVLSPYALGAMVKASADPNADLIRIDASGGNPTMDAAVANTLAQVYLQTIQRQNQAKLSQATNFLSKQVADVQGQLQQASAQLAKAQANAGTTADAQSRVAADDQQLASLQGQLVQAQVALKSDQAGLASVQKQLKATAPTLQTTQASPTGTATPTAAAAATATATSSQDPNPLYQSLQQQAANEQVTIAQDEATVNQLQAIIESFGYDTTALSQAGGTEEMVSLQSQLVQAQVALSAAKAAEANLQSQMKTTAPTLPPSSPQAPKATPNPVYQDLLTKQSQLSLAAAQDGATVAQLVTSVAAVKQEINTLPTVSPVAEANIQTLTQKVSQLTQTYQTLTAGLTQSQVAASVDGGNPVVTLAAPATVPTVPVKPNKKLNVALAFVVGLIASAGLSLLLELLDNTVKTPDDIRRLTELPTLAIIPHGGR